MKKGQTINDLRKEYMAMRALETAKKPQKQKYRAFAWKNGKKTAEIYEGDELLEILDIAKDPNVVYFTLSVLDRPARR